MLLHLEKLVGQELQIQRHFHIQNVMMDLVATLAL